MAASDDIHENNAKPALMKRMLVVLLPVIFLVLTYLVLFSRHRVAGPRGEEKITLSQAESQALAEHSKSLLDQSRYVDALKPTLTLSKAYPDEQIYMRRLADIYDHVGRYDEEAKYWEKFMDHSPTPIEACPQIGNAYWKQGANFEAQAISAYQRCLQLEPKNTDSLFYLGHALEMSGQWPRAAEQYQKGLAISPNYADLALGLARCWLRMNKLGGAKKLAEQVLARSPNSSGALLVLGIYYLHASDYAAAKKVLNRGAALADKDPDFPLLLIRVDEQTHDNADALREYNRLVELMPGDLQLKARRDALAAQTASK